MPYPLIRKLEQYAELSSDEKAALREAVSEVVDYGPGEDVIRQCERPDHVHLLLNGWAARYKDLPEGERHIMAFLIPGDLCDIQITLLDEMDHGIGTLSPCKVAFFARDKMDELLTGRDPLARALWWSTLVDEAVLREWLVNLGARDAEKRVAHLFCEMLLRCRAVGLTDDHGFDVPLTQDQLAQATGMTVVHMNRTLQKLRAEGLISFKGVRLEVTDLEGLMALCDFDASYLHQAVSRWQGTAALQRREPAGRPGPAPREGA